MSDRKGQGCDSFPIEPNLRRPERGGHIDTYKNVLKEGRNRAKSAKNGESSSDHTPWKTSSRSVIIEPNLRRTERVHDV